MNLRRLQHILIFPEKLRLTITDRKISYASFQIRNNQDNPAIPFTAFACARKRKKNERTKGFYIIISTILNLQRKLLYLASMRASYTACMLHDIVIHIAMTYMK